MRHRTPGRPEDAASAAQAQPMDFPRPMGATPRDPLPPMNVIPLEIRGGQVQHVDAGEWPSPEPGASARNFGALLQLAGSDSLSGHIGNAAQIVSLAAQLGEPLDAQQLAAVRRRLLAALMIVEGVA